MRFIVGNIAIIGLCFFLTGEEKAHAQYTNKSSVLDGSGARSSGGNFTNISASGQPGGVVVSSGGTFVNQAGFLNTFMLKPDLDTDGDGLADELDQDNDNDGLADAREISGSGFNPTTPTQVNATDTDGDGASDGAEAAAGTDPTNIDALLNIIRIAQAGGQEVGWIARGGKTYILHARTNLLAGNFDPIATNTAVGGVAPWFITTNAIVDASNNLAEFYAVEVLP